jgi:Sugar transferases involved in lipopolysaccharide synthesis
MYKSELTRAMRWEIARRMAEDYLPEVNRRCKKVRVRDNFYTRYGKRALDIIISTIALAVAFPINLLIGIVTYFDVGRPIFFKQARLGKDGKLFTIIKFRNMRNTKDERGELLPPSQRVTKFGRFVRKTSLDELLNFWSILKGDMSLIGPRPLLPEHLTRFSDRHRQRLAVRPGLECPPRNDINHVWTWHEQFENDVWYVQNVSFLTDCKMVLSLFKFALDRKSASARATVARGIFTGYSVDGRAITLDEIPQAYVDKITQEMETSKNMNVSNVKKQQVEIDVALVGQDALDA